MRIRLIALTLVAGAIALGTTTAGAHFDREPCNGTVTAQAAGDQTVYVDDRSTGEPGDINHWVYVESNGHPGVQTGGTNDVHGLESIPGAFDFADPCMSTHGIANGQDTLVF